VVPAEGAEVVAAVVQPRRAIRSPAVQPSLVGLAAVPLVEVDWAAVLSGPAGNSAAAPFHRAARVVPQEAAGFLQPAISQAVELQPAAVLLVSVAAEPAAEADSLVRFWTKSGIKRKHHALLS
jgi:hypothetical protein